MSVKFNGVLVPDFIRIVGISFSTVSDISIQESSTPNRIGNYDAGIERGAAMYTLDLQLIDSSKSIFQMKRELKAWLKGDNWKVSKLEFEDNPGKYLLARLGSDAEINDLFTHGETSIAFHCSDPREYDTDLTELSYSESDFNVPYEGLEKASTVLTVTVPEAIPRIRIEHSQSGKSVTLTGSFVQGDIILIDHDKKLVKVNDKITMKLVDYSTEWLYLDTGDNDFKIYKFGSGNFEPLNAEIELTYRGVD